MSKMTTKKWWGLGALLTMVSASASAVAEIPDLSQLFAAGNATDTQNIPPLLMPADLTTGCTFTHASTILCTVPATSSERRLPFSHSAGESKTCNVAIVNGGTAQ